MSLLSKVQHLFDGTYSREDILIRICSAIGIHPHEYRVLKFMRRVPKAQGLRYVPLKTYDGSGQATHPDILHDGARYVMALTPYPRSNDKFENPSLYTSLDCKKWAPVRDASPLVRGYLEEGKYNSDPDIIHHNGTYLLFYRVHQTYSQIMNYIYCMSSEDLHVWSEPQLVFKSEGYPLRLLPCKIRSQSFGLKIETGYSV